MRTSQSRQSGKNLSLGLPAEPAISPDVKESIGKVSKFMQAQKIQDLSSVLRCIAEEETVIMELG